ncbi:MAG: hypothetical protein ACI9AR_000117 [Flavobacteriaceae bacterium]|jgi:hypothetical protein
MSTDEYTMLLSRVALSTEDRAFWERKLSQVEDHESKMLFIDLIFSQKENISKFTSIQRQKEEAIQHKDYTLWEDLFEEEAQYFEDLQE